MNLLFEESDYLLTPITPLSLWCKCALSLEVDISETKFDDEHLMSRLFTASEIKLAPLGLAVLSRGGFDIIVGGLGIGYTFQTVLELEAVSALTVVDMLEAVIDRHPAGILPPGPKPVGGERCRLVQGDFYAATGEASFDSDAQGRRFDTLLVDIDHLPDALFDDRGAGFYRPVGLRTLAFHLKPGGIFGFWSNDRPDQSFTDQLSRVFAEAWAESVTFPKPLQNSPFTQTVYIARTAITLSRVA